MNSPRSAHLDPQCFAFQRRGGISRYFTQLISHRSSMEPHGVSLRARLPLTVNEHLLALESSGVVAPPRIVNSTRILKSAYALVWPRGRQRDILHHTYYDARYLDRKARVRVSTIHDMIPELFPRWFPTNPHVGKSEYIKRSDLLICVSERTREDLLSLYPRVEGKTRVVHLGVDFDFYSRDRVLSKGPKWPFILFVGPRGGHKDFETLVRSLACIPGLSQDVGIVAAGGGPFTSKERLLLKEHRVGRRSIQIDVTDEQLAAHYAKAQVLVVCSRYEGFGLPLLEAMAARCPVITSNAGSLPEVAGDAALLFEPGQAEELAERIERLVQDASLRKELVERGALHARRMTWEDTSAQTARYYRECG